MFVRNSSFIPTSGLVRCDVRQYVCCSLLMPQLLRRCLTLWKDYVQEREAKRAKLKFEHASAYIQQDTVAETPGQAKPITAVCCHNFLMSIHTSRGLQLSS